MGIGRAAIRETPFPPSVDPQRGSTLLYTVLALTTLAALGAATTLLVPGTNETTLAGADAQRARYLALSGLNLWSPGTAGTFRLGQDAIILAASGPDASGAYTITSTGMLRAGTNSETSIRLTATRGGNETISFADDLDDFQNPVVDDNANSDKAITVFSDNPENAPKTLTVSEWTSLWSQNISRYAGGWMRLGGDTSKTVGAVWYAGSKSSCASGVCNFATGLRAYFQFVFMGYDDQAQSKKYGDGFTFAVITAANDAHAVGGPASGVRGEYLGYAGPGPSGKGIVPPKIAIEIDTYPNRNGGDPLEANSRLDASNANHLAVVYWGASDTTYDDNVHGAGTPPQNPGNTSAGYVEKAKAATGPNWLEDGEEHALRVEMHRTATATYTVMAWVDPVDCGAKDVSADFTAEEPNVKSVVTLNAADHTQLATVRFGFTEATGTATSQNVAIHDFAMRFRQ
ncbi:MAG: hypothetical protein ACP59X_04230 [Solidesulfovibrio sp. DCME]|uniref:hypothetical protein n=1 Tax=Solidesulfovibrio sp. DCME TaxID=3447380 RepID=UPI003D0ADAA8